MGRKTNYLNSTTESYSYDAIYQLQQVTQAATTTESYTYDEVGNRLSSQTVGSYNYNSSNQLTSADGTSFTYDNNGNTLTKSDTNGQTTYAWDVENRLTSVTLANNGGVVSFKYDPFGRRIQKSGPSGTTIYVYDGANAIEELTSAGAVSARYVQGSGIDEPLARSASGISYYNADGLGSITSLDDASGTPTATFVYGAFGVLSTSSGSTTNSYRYTAREYDQDTGLYYYRARYYDSSSGRMLSEDPLSLQEGGSAYPYVENSPINSVDPSGLQHTPGGPWHPDPWVQYGCLGTDDCATLSWKISMFKKIIAAHLAWDAAHNTNYHSLTDIPQHMNGLNWCIQLHQAKCTNNCPKFAPVPPEADPVVETSKPRVNVKAVGVAVGGAATAYFIYRIVRMLPSLAPPLWWTIPFNAVTP
jgi:RHS repeat-associated protein